MERFSSRSSGADVLMLTTGGFGKGKTKRTKAGFFLRFSKRPSLRDKVDFDLRIGTQEV